MHRGRGELMDGVALVNDAGVFTPIALLLPTFVGRGPGRQPTDPVTGTVGRLFPLPGWAWRFRQTRLAGRLCH